MIGETLSHYQIIEKIGAGGMGEVYRARDPRLGRDVAIKILPSSFAERTDRLARFEQEARAAGALNHPNILAIHDVGNERGVPFLVSELLDGENLRDRINSGSLTQRKAIEYAAQIADGLAAAHGHNIVHRDLKPENIFITRSGHAKILDFGLAKLTEHDPMSPINTESPTEALTDTNVVVGTPGYMSPEQLHGGTADHRSDIFAFGVVLYEMLTDRRPFTGGTAAEVSASILRDEPTPLSDSHHPVPPTLDRLVRQCLEKSPDERFESAHDLAHMLRAVSDTGEVPKPPPTPPKRWRWLPAAAGGAGIAIATVIGWALVDFSPAPGIPEVRHIVVMPFEAVGDDPDDRFLAAGLAETVADGLSIVERETLGATWVVRPHPGSTLEDARKDYNATIAVRGEFETGEERVQLDLQLVDTASGETLARRTLDESLQNLTDLQQEPVRMVWDMLGFQPTPPVLAELDSMVTNTVSGCRMFLIGRGQLVIADGEADLLAAAASLEQAVEENPGCGPARVGLADAFVRLYATTGAPGWKERALTEARHAVELDGDSPEPYLVLGSLHASAHEPDLELEALRRATSVSRTAGAYLALGSAATDAESYDEAEAALQTAINLRPDDIDPHDRLAYLYARMGRYDAAANEFRHASRAAPANVLGHINLGAILYFQGRRDEAQQAFENAVAAEPNEIAYSNLGGLRFEEGRYGDAAEMFEKAIALLGDDLPDDRYYLLGNLAGARYWGGEKERAKVSYQQAIDLAKKNLVNNPGDASVMADLAGYHAMIGEHDRGLELLEIAVRSDIRDAYVMGAVAESFEDLGERDRAVHWIETALGSGLDIEWIERRPSLNSLREDGRYKDLFDQSSKGS